jgi:hypothetical protein
MLSAWRRFLAYASSGTEHVFGLPPEAVVTKRLQQQIDQLNREQQKMSAKIDDILAEVHTVCDEVSQVIAKFTAGITQTLVNTNVAPQDQAKLDGALAELNAADAALKSILAPVKAAIDPPKPTGINPITGLPMDVVPDAAPTGAPTDIMGGAPAAQKKNVVPAGMTAVGPNDNPSGYMDHNGRLYTFNADGTVS